MRALKTVAILIILCILSGMTPAFAADMPYRITVDCTNNIVTVYSTLDDTIVRQMICSVGMGNWPTPRGTFIMPKPHKTGERTEWYTFEDGYGKYGSRIKGNFLFHSYLFYEKDEDTIKWESYAALGSNASHGCVRLYIEDAKWICENCLPGTEVKIYDADKRNEYIKELVYAKTYSIDSGISYEEFASIASDDTEMGYSSKGENVTALQNRMIELGLYGGEADGNYGADMVRAVKAIQTALGMKVTGVVDQSMLELLMSDNAPTSTVSTLKKGMGGPAVVSMQTALARLGLYTGEMDGDFDEETEESVKLFQRLCKYDETGVASGELQQNMADSINKLNGMYGEGGYALIFEESIVQSAVVVSDGKLNMRKKQSTESNVVERLAPGSQLSVLSKGGEWTEVSYEGETGYVRTSYLDFSQTSVRTPKYIAADAEHPALDTDIESTVNVIRTQEVVYGVVNIKERLNVREKPDSNSKLAFILSPATPVRILSVSDSWAYISYGERTGFAKSTYFDKTRVVELSSSAIINSYVEDDLSSTYFAQVIADDGADLHSTASESGEVIAHIPHNSRAEVLLRSSQWTQVKYDGMTGYISNESAVTGTLAEIETYLQELEASKKVYALVASDSAAGLNMRAQPSTESEILCVLENGTVIQILSDDGEWCSIEYNGMTGCVMSAYVSYIDETSDPSDSPDTSDIAPDDEFMEGETDGADPFDAADEDI